MTILDRFSVSKSMYKRCKWKCPVWMRCDTVVKRRRGGGGELETERRKRWRKGRRWLSEKAFSNYNGERSKQREKNQDHLSHIMPLSIWVFSILIAIHVCHQWSTRPDPTFQPVAITILIWNVPALWDFKKWGLVKLVITTGRDCGPAEWINRTYRSFWVWPVFSVHCGSSKGPACERSCSLCWGWQLAGAGTKGWRWKPWWVWITGWFIQNWDARWFLVFTITLFWALLNYKHFGR